MQPAQCTQNTVCKAIHPNGYMAVQLPPCTLAFDAVDPNSRFAPKLKLKISNSEQIAWLRAMDDKAKEAIWTPSFGFARHHFG